MELGKHTQEEIFSQPESWESALSTLNAKINDLKEIWDTWSYDQVVITGCGSSYYLALSAAVLIEQLSGIPARGVPASEAWFSHPTYFANRRSLLIAVSRSGLTTETIKACERFLESGSGDLLTISCYPEAPMASMGMTNIILPSGQEQSIAQTRAFSTLYLANIYLSSLWGEREDLLDSLNRLPAIGRRILSNSKGLAEKLGRDADIDRFYFLGSGPRYGLACELSLKMKEMSLSHSEPFHFMEFRHGPMSMVTDSTLMVGLVSPTNKASELKVLDEMRNKGARVLVMSNQDADVSFDADLDEVASNILYMPVGHILAFERSISRGLDPDKPLHLTTVIELDE